MTLYYADIRVHVNNTVTKELLIGIEAPSFSVVVAQLEAFVAGYHAAIGTKIIGLGIVGISSGKKPKGRNFHRLSDSATIYEELSK